MHNPYRAFTNRSKSIDDYVSKQTISSDFAYSKNVDTRIISELERLEKLYGNNLKKYDINFNFNDKPQTFEEFLSSNSSLTLKPKDQLTCEANEEARLTRINIDYYALDLDNKYVTGMNNLDFAACGLFYEPENDLSIKAWEWFRPNWITKNLFSDKKIFKMFANFYNYSSEEYIKDLRSFACFDRFMGEFAKQLENNPDFKEALLDMNKGQQVIDFIKSEASKINPIDKQKNQFINQYNQKVLQNSAIVKDLKCLQPQFENELKQDPNHKIDWQDNINALEKTIKNTVAFNSNYTLSKNGISLLDYLKINKTNFISFTGNHLQQHFHKKAVDKINTSAELWKNTTNTKIRDSIEVAVTFAFKCTELNRVSQFIGANACINAATDILTGVALRCKEIPQNIKDFSAHPFDTIMNKCDDIAISTYNIIASTTKAVGFLLAITPSSHGIPTPSELKKVQNIDQKAQEIKQIKNHINRYLENTPSTEMLQCLGYVVTDVVLDVGITKAGFKALSTLKGPALKTALALHGKTLKKLGPIGDEVAKLTGLAIDKGVKATEALIDAVRHQPELVTAEGGLFNFVEKTLEKEQKIVSGFKEIGKDFSQAEKVIENSKFTLGCKINHFAKQNKHELLKSARNIEKLIQEHKAKLDAYIKNPYAYDNKGLLKNAPTTEIRQQRILGRIENLKNQIYRQKDDLKVVQNLLKEKNNESKFRRFRSNF